MLPPSADQHGQLRPAPPLIARFRADLAALIDGERDSVLVAVSGGADSLALLLLTHATIGGRCFAATVDHRLRAASADEAAHVAGICAARGIPHVVLSGALPARAGRTANLSARARLLRYRLLEDHAGACGDARLATAHHADDQLETLVMRLNRGAGVAGLSGIRRRGGRIIRPLLGWRRTELAELVARCGVTPVADPSNVDDRFDRARLRKVLAGVDWLDADRIGASAGALAEAEDALAWSTRALLAERSVASEGSITLDPVGLPPEYLRRLVIHCLETLERHREPTGPAVARMIAALADGRPAMLGPVLATVATTSEGIRWTFRPAPPRRGH